MGLFGPIWLKSNLNKDRMEKALNAVRELDDPARLKEAVLKSHYREIREAARDYSVGTTYYQCTRCGEKKNLRYVDTL